MAHFLNAFDKTYKNVENWLKAHKFSGACFRDINDDKAVRCLSLMILDFGHYGHGC